MTDAERADKAEAACAEMRSFLEALSDRLDAGDRCSSCGTAMPRESTLIVHIDKLLSTEAERDAARASDARHKTAYEVKCNTCEAILAERDQARTELAKTTSLLKKTNTLIKDCDPVRVLDLEQQLEQALAERDRFGDEIAQWDDKYHMLLGKWDEARALCNALSAALYAAKETKDERMP